MQEDGNYIFENYQPLKKNGSYWECQVFEEDDYIFQLHQENVRAKHEEESSLSRSTIIIAKKAESKYEYVAGIMAHYEEDTTLKTRLKPGTYIIYTKFDPSITNQKLPSNSSVSIYSLHYVILDTIDRLKCEGMLSESFLAYAKNHKRKKYEDNTLWISYKLMFKEAGYAFIAFGV